LPTERAQVGAEYPAQALDAEPDFAQLNLLGRSPRFLQALALIRKVAACDAIVLIEGETGTGKELAARSIHYLGKRRNAPFIAVNCGSIPDTLIESEFFGHVRGAFTDARESHAGVVAQARAGTLFLDEIEALSPRGQVMLLRFLQDQEYRPLGGPLVRGANVRVICASNANLREMATKKRFRADLLFRVSVLVLQLPALRERPGDAELLAERFISALSAQYGLLPKALDARAREYLGRYDWPGNVRELENFIHREIVLSDGPQISLHSAPVASAHVTDPPPQGAGTMTDEGFRKAKARVIADFERAYVAELLRRSHGNVSLAARLSGKERSRFGKLLKKYALNRGAFANEPEKS